MKRVSFGDKAFIFGRAHHFPLKRAFEEVVFFKGGSCLASVPSPKTNECCLKINGKLVQMYFPIEIHSLNIGHPKRKLVFKPSPFVGEKTVHFRGCIRFVGLLSPLRWSLARTDFFPRDSCGGVAGEELGPWALQMWFLNPCFLSFCDDFLKTWKILTKYLPCLSFSQVLILESTSLRVCET